MKHTYTTPESQVIKFEICDHLMFNPMSQQGGDQMSGKKDSGAESGWTIDELATTDEEQTSTW